MKAVVTGATGFLGGHVTKLLAERGDDVRVTYRNPERLKHLDGVKVRRAKADVLDYKAMRRAMKGAEVLFHTVGFVGSNPAELVWRMNAHAPVVAVEAAAASTATTGACAFIRHTSSAGLEPTKPTVWKSTSEPFTARRIAL